MDKKHYYDMGIVGNCAYLGYIDSHTNVSFLCWPKFDSSFVFGGLLDDEKGGEFSIKPASGAYKGSQTYIENTNVLTTTIDCTEGKYQVIDFAPRFYQHDRYYKPLMLVRKVVPLEGTPRVKVTCRPVGEYGRTEVSSYRGSNHMQFEGLESSMRLTTDISLSYIDEGSGFVLNETKYLILTFGQPMEASLARTAERFLNETINYWRLWVKSTSIPHFKQEQVIRSALVLKIHQYEDTGAIIAAGTTSLPEAPGSGRNWDYRYNWLRDAFYTLTAFNNIGHFEELERYFQYIANVSSKEQERYQPLYRISGGHEINEVIHAELKGYKGNMPVRVGNQAYEHIQNDVYGQVLVSLLPLFVDNRFIGAERRTSVGIISHALDMIDRTMDEPDAGLWEFRDIAQKHCYTYLFHWAGANAAYKVARSLKDTDMMHKAQGLAQEAAKHIEACYDPARMVYTQGINVPHLDAACLQLIMMGYLDGGTAKAHTHLKALEKELKTKEGLFYRYKRKDDFGEPETTFLICAFWYVEALAVVGRVDEAVEVFESLLEYANPLGLLSEDVHAQTGSQWGNFPQAYSHVGLVNAAFRIARKLDQPNFL